MARSIRSKRGKELRRIQREKLSHWDNKRVLKLSNALSKSSEHVKYLKEDGSEGVLSEEQQQKVSQVLAEKASDMEISDHVEIVEEPKKERTLTQIIKGTGVPKRKKRVAARYGRNKKKKKKT